MRDLVSVLAAAGLASLSSGCARSSPAPAAPAAPVASTPPQAPSAAECALTIPPIPVLFQGAEMLPICDAVYAEPGSTPEDIAELKRAFVIGRRDLARAFRPKLRSSPLTLFCRTPECKIAFGAPRAAAESKDLGFARDAVPTRDGLLEHGVVIVSGPVPNSHRILTHELVHAEMKAWVPYDKLPTWFNEGMATYIAGEPDCSGDRASGVDVRQLTTKLRWQAFVAVPGQGSKAYCGARGEVARWAVQFESDDERARALEDLMHSVASGIAFELVYVGADRQ